MDFLYPTVMLMIHGKLEANFGDNPAGLPAFAYDIQKCPD
jgi:hypothetical protein